MIKVLSKFNRIMSLSLKKLQKRVHKSPECSDDNSSSSNGNGNKPPKKSGRFDGLSEQEIMDMKCTLSDILEPDLDLVFVGINPSLMAAYTGRYYAGPGNHFYPLLYESQLIPEPITYENDRGLLNYKIGLTNIVARATRSSADLTRMELKKGAAAVHDKLKKFKPKIAVFNGKCIYEEFADKYDKSSFRFGLQPSRVGDTTLWVVPSSSARCANFPRMQDKLHFYTSLKKYLAYLKGEIEKVNPEEFRFDGRCKQVIPSTSKMWRRKGISAFANGGRIVNKETIDMDTSDDSLCIPKTNEFIVIKKQSQEDSDDKDSYVSGSQDLSQKSESDVVKQESSLSTEADRELSQECKTETDESNGKEQNDSQSKKKLRSNGRLSRSKLPSRAAVTTVVKQRSETIDFMGLIKQRLSNKREVADDDDDDGENCQDESPSQPQPAARVKRLNYGNLCTDKSKRGFKIKTK